MNFLFVPARTISSKVVEPIIAIQQRNRSSTERGRSMPDINIANQRWQMCISIEICQIAYRAGS
jgi:hypothetical protein